MNCDFKKERGERIAQFVNDPDSLVEFLRPIFIESDKTY